MATTVYWIHRPEHTDMFTQGYIGVTKLGRHERRFREHKNSKNNVYLRNTMNKYNDIVQKVLLIADEDYCLEIEQKLRPDAKIGWNIVAGGGKPPVAYGNKFNVGRSPANKGVPISYELKAYLSKIFKGRASWNKGKKTNKPSWNRGIKTPEETRAKQSLAKIGKTSPRKGLKHTPESIEKIRQAHTGVSKITEAGRLTLSMLHKGRKHALLTCPHCGKIGGATAMPRWHFDNCRNKEI